MWPAAFFEKGEAMRRTTRPGRFLGTLPIFVVLALIVGRLSLALEAPARPAGPTILEGDVEIRGNLTVAGTITVQGRLTADSLRTASGLLRFGSDDTAATLDQTLFLQRKCGSRDEQSALVQQPASSTNGALFLQVPGDRLPPSSIAAQHLQYGPLKPGNPRRQRFSPGTVYVQSDGNGFADLSSTLSGTGEPGTLAPLPVLLDFGTVTPARMDATGFRILIPAHE